jgi:predicted alpha/beta superfamily hydrolase
MIYTKDPVFAYHSLKYLFIRMTISFFCFIYCHTKVAGQNMQAEVCIAGTMAHSFISKINAQAYQLSISLPFNYSAADTIHYPVMYILDSDPNLPLAALIQRNMSYDHEVPDVILVGVGYQVSDFLASRPFRMLDYTPTRVPKIDSEMTANHHMKMVSGGAYNFLRVLEEEVIPYIEKSYKTNNDRSLAGHSFGGLFAVYTLFHKPALFKKYLISSPSLEWDDREMLKEETQFYDAEHTALKAKVFISVGSIEPEPMVPDMNKLVKVLRNRNYKELELTDYIFEDETHLSVIPFALSKGMRNLYNPAINKK